MARLVQLKLSMSTSILLIIIFAIFLGVITLILQLPIIWGFIATLFFILFQYLIGPAIVRGSTHLRYVCMHRDGVLDERELQLAMEKEAKST